MSDVLTRIAARKIQILVNHMAHFFDIGAECITRGAIDFAHFDFELHAGERRA